MGLFSKKGTCSICNKSEAKTKIYDGMVCKECLRSCGGYLPLKPFKEQTINDVKTAIKSNKDNKDLAKNFNITKKIGTYIEFDDDNMKWLVPDGLFGKKINPRVYDYKDIIGFELLEDGYSITEGGLGKAVAGGLLFGEVGAVVGGITSKRKTKAIVNDLRIKITLDNLSSPMVCIPLLIAKTKSGSLTYKGAYSSAQEILSALSIIVKNNEKNTNIHNSNNISYSVADEIYKLKKLSDDGIITDEEFITKKKALLGL